MKALAVRPGVAHSVEMVEVEPPQRTDGALRVKSRAIGICGTDVEIIERGYGEAPPGEDRLIIGHESLGEVVEAPEGSGFTPGALVVGVVRRPDPQPCDHCAVGEWDMCRNGFYSECGIKNEHGYAREEFLLDPQYAVKIDPRLGEFGVLLEPASVVVKACAQSLIFMKRTQVAPKTALITGAGPIGLLAALATRQYGLETYVVDIVEDGPKPELVRQIGAHYHAGSAQDLDISPEVVIECTGIGTVVRDAGTKAAPGAVIALTGISASQGTDIDLNVLNKGMVLSNKVLFGSVNASREHYEIAARILGRTDPGWLAALISRRVPLQSWPEAFERRPDDVKVVLEMGTMERAA